MIITTADPYWVWIVPQNRQPFLYVSDEEKWEHNGKWVILGDKSYIQGLVFDIDPLVEKGLIDAAKITKKDPATDPVPHVKEYAMCVYSDGRKKDVAADILHGLGVKEFSWKYDTDSVKDWSEGGTLANEAAKAGRKVDPYSY